MESTGILAELIEYAAIALELLGVLVIVGAFLYVIVIGLFHFTKRKEGAFERVKTGIGKALQMALEFLIAADIIRTVLIEPTVENLTGLGFLIIIRTILSWSIIVEIEGCLPWQVAKMREE